tara:strand:+ start:505 stop:1677 length:1173 start_codon:yes stop_codon:yes gene_type:complete
MRKNRIESIDFLRGLVMIIMALDHVRDYFFFGSFTSNPTDLGSTTPLLFYTRIITHYCAPVFVLLTGTSAYLYGAKKDKKTLSKFLLTRGIWLIFLEIVINNFIWFFDPSYSFIVLQVIWAIGFSMLFLSGIIYFSNKIISIIGLAIIFLHNLFDVFVFEGQSLDAIVWYFLHQQSLIKISDSTSLVFGYPIIPWIGLMALGFVIGSLYTNYQTKDRIVLLMKYGIYSILTFVLLRLTNFYGEPNPFTIQKNITFSIMALFNTTKYPPSLQYLLMTIGPALIILSVIEKYKNKVTDFFIVFGRVPLFYYFSHVLIIHSLAIILLFINNKDYSIMLNMTPFLPDQNQLMEYGYPLWVVYLVWFIVIIILYPLCYKYMNYKSNSKKWWLSYL